ncbi:MAG: DinB family protein [Pseudomonadota bacterium]
MKAHFGMMARYNAWANRRLYDAAAALSDEARRRDEGAFFGSLHRTLNHLVTTDVIWLSRFRGKLPPPWGLDHVPHDDFDELRAAREALDADIIGYVDGLGEDDLAADFSYARVSAPDERITQPLAPALAHFFNHQTHHRGQCHMILTRLTGDAPALDLIFYQREAG